MPVVNHSIPLRILCSHLNQIPLYLFRRDEATRSNSMRAPESPGFSRACLFLFGSCVLARVRRGPAEDHRAAAGTLRYAVRFRCTCTVLYSTFRVRLCSHLNSFEQIHALAVNLKSVIFLPSQFHSTSVTGACCW